MLDIGPEPRSAIKASPRTTPDPPGSVSSPRKLSGALDNSIRSSPRVTPDALGFVRKNSGALDNRISSRSTLDASGPHSSAKKHLGAQDNANKTPPRSSPESSSLLPTTRKHSGALDNSSRISPRSSPDPQGLTTSTRKISTLLDNSVRSSPKLTQDSLGSVSLVRKISLGMDNFTKITSRSSTDPSALETSVRKNSLPLDNSSRISPRATSDPSGISTRKSTTPSASESANKTSPSGAATPTRRTSVASGSPSKMSPRASPDTKGASPAARRSSATVVMQDSTGRTSKKNVAPASRIPSHSVNDTTRRVPASAGLSDTSIASGPGSTSENVRSNEDLQRLDALTVMTYETMARLNKLVCSASNKGAAKEESLNDAALNTGVKSDVVMKDYLNKQTNYCYEEQSSDSKNKGLPSASEELVHTNSTLAESSSADICIRSNTSSPSRYPSSILKKKSFDEPHIVILPSTNTTQPVSILKRKTSQDDGGSGGGSTAPAPPVTFSPLVKDQTRSSSSRRQGILKKRASLDESEVLRRRSCSPDMNFVITGESNFDFKPILKHQRRSSMEELVGRTQSPDPQPQSILKRRTSREDEVEERTTNSPEPQGILKRKSNVSSSSSSNSTSPHVSIAASVIMTVAGMEGGDFAAEGTEQVRPILKKKSSSEENTTADSSSAETPRPILKKKSSVEDDVDDRPKKPILKSSRKHSQEEAGSESPTRCLKLRSCSTGASDSTSGSDGEVVKPILKHGVDGLRSHERSASPRPRLSFCDDEEPIVSVGSPRGSDESRHSSPSRNGVILRRHSRSSTSAMRSASFAADGELSSLLCKRRSWEPTTQGVESDSALLTWKSGSSHSDHIQRPVSVAERILNMENFLEQETVHSPSTSSSMAQTGAVPKRLGFLRTTRDRERFHTQPVTQEELQASARLQSFQSFKNIVIERKASVNGLKNSKPDGELSACCVDVIAQESASAPSVANGALSKKEDINLSDKSPPPSPCKKSPEMEDAMDTELPGLSRSSSVSAKASLFMQLEEQMKQAAAEAKSRRVPKGGSRFRERKEELVTRFATQPVTQGEVQEAVRQNQRSGEPGTMSARAAREKMYEHSAQVLSRSGSGGRLLRNSSKDVSGQDSKPKGILKNSFESDSRRSSLLDADPETESDCEVKGILKTGNSSGSRTQTPELESFRHLKSVLKKETSADESESHEIVSATNEHLRSILKPESTEWTAEEDSSSTEAGSSSSSDGEPSSRPIRAPPSVRSSLRGGSGIDLVSILHGVEANARKQRQALITPPNNKQKLGEEKLKNIKNLSQEKENQLENAYQKKKADENHLATLKKSIECQVFNSKIVEHKSTVNQRKLESKQLMDEMNHIKKTEIIKLDERKVRRKLEELTVDTSDGDTSSSGGREVRRIIRNEAVARRRQAGINKQQREKCALVKSHSQTSVPNAPEDARGGLQRSSTQPMSGVETATMSGASIADRLAALQKSGNSDWRKRLSRLNPEDDLSILTTNNHINELHCRRDEDERSILADRLDKLDAATQGWKKRVGPTDAVKFSVAGRMQMEGSPASPTLGTVSSPLPAQLQPGGRLKRTPRAARFRSKTAHLKDTSSTPSSPQKETPVAFKRSVSAPGGDEENGLADEEFQGPKVSVPRTDDETFSEFFRSISTASSKKVQSERMVIRDEDLDMIISQTNQLVVQKRTVKFQRRNAASRNPIKALAARTDLQNEYIELKSGVAEKEMKRLKVEQLAKHSPLAVEALAGLASKEDFTAVALRKASPSTSAMLPHKELMLLQVKGRRHVQTRLVEPVATSINRGDCYVLVTPTEVFNWIGRYSNVIERSRGAEVAQHIQQKKDLGCSGGSQVITISEDKVTCTSSQKDRFWRLLGSTSDLEGTSGPSEAGHPDEDELFETSMIATNLTYEVQSEELVPVEECWGCIPRISVLDPAKILVFDFGSELYVWNGKNASLEDRRLAQRLARELWEEGFDYSECDVCPLNIASSLGGRAESQPPPLKGASRPSWALLAKVNQHMETVLFREKFLDWPDFSRVIRSKGSDDIDKQMDAGIDVKPCDAKEMLEPNLSEPDLELENTHLGRGQHYFDEESHRQYEITTLGVRAWHILEYEHSQLPEASVGQFHSGDSYVVRWQYSVTVTGRELSGLPSRHSMPGRDRCVYFCWQGRDASLNEQGAAALLTVELDHERGPQVRVVQGSEHPVFLNLFAGNMVVLSGRREEDNRDCKGPWKLFVCRGERMGEAVLVQVACSVRQLRSRAGLVLVNTATGVVHIWLGSKATKNTRQVVQHAAEQLKKKRSAEVGFKDGVMIIIQQQEEGSESKEFFKGLGGGSRQLYVSLADHMEPKEHTPRLFHLSSVSGTFSAVEVLGPYRQEGEPFAYPFLQEDLYGASQPGLFLLDNCEELWLWQGWWPDISSSDDSQQTGSGAVRWQAERRAAMQTALDYWRLTRRISRLKAFLVWAGLEPLAFTNLFPMWTDRDDIAELNIKDGRKAGEVLTVEDELARLTRSTYPPAQLLQRPLPDGVDPTHLELYLDPHHFQELLGMSKEDFLELPLWKQTNMKKDVGLF